MHGSSRNGSLGAHGPGDLLHQSRPNVGIGGLDGDRKQELIASRRSRPQSKQKGEATERGEYGDMERQVTS